MKQPSGQQELASHCPEDQTSREFLLQSSLLSLVDGKYLTQWGGMGFWRGRFRVSSGIAIGHKGNVYVADYYNDRVQKFNGAGRFITKWGSEGDKSGQFKGPTGIAVDNEGSVYVIDWGNHRIQVFSPL